MAKDEKGNIYISEAQSRARAAWDDKKIEQEAHRIARQKARAERTDEEQLKRLDALLGPGLGAKRERARLQKRIEEKKNKKPNKVEG